MIPAGQPSPGFRESPGELPSPHPPPGLAPGSRPRLVAVLALVFAPFFLNGWYNPLLVDHPALFWGLDLAAWLLLPGVGVGYLVWGGHLTWERMGLGHPLGEGEGWLPLVLTCLGAALLLHLAYTGGEALGERLFPVNWLKTREFSYERMMPAAGVGYWVVLVYFSFTAGVVEEVYYRGLPRLLFGDGGAGVAAYVVWSSLAFSVVHWEGGVHNLTSALLVGVVTGLFYAWRRSLYPLMVGHVVTDLLAFANP